MQHQTEPNSIKKPHPVDVFVGQKIRKIRKNRGLSQTQLGNGVGVTFQQVQKYERGTNRIGSSRLFKISSELKVPVGSLFDGVEDVVPEHDVYDGIEEGKNLQSLYNQIRDPNIRKQLIEIATVLAQTDTV